MVDEKKDVVVVAEEKKGEESEVSEAMVVPEEAGASIKDYFSGGSGSDVTSQQIIHELNIIDSNLAMKTEIRNVQATSAMEVVALANTLVGKHNVAKVYDAIIKQERINAVSHKRKGRLEQINGFVAVAIEEIKQKKNALDDVFGGGRK